MLKPLAGLVLVLALSLGSACKKDEAKPGAPPEPPKTTEPAAPAPAPAAGAEAPKPGDPTGGGKLLEGIDKHSLTGGTGKSLDGMANFGFGSGPAGDAKAACEQYGKDVGSFLSDMQTEYKALQDNMDSQGADALQRFGDFLVKGAATLKGLKIDNAGLAAAHGEFAAALETMGGGFVEAAAAVRAQDEPAGQKAIEKVQAGAGQVQAAFGKLEQVCGG
jgi:hypothetical protein